MENFLHGYPANRDNVPFSITRQLPGGGTQTKTVQVHVAGCALRTPFYQCAHELSHSLGTVDMYNNGAGNYGLTLMSGYSFEADDQVPVHLDAWHKIGAGEADPYATGLNWHPNSGNIIGQGWSAGHRAMAAISDIILLISEQGELRWYRYFGNGESDPGATGLNWDGNSGNIIGRGWDRFRHIFGGSDGRGGYVIFAVDEGQDLHWYRYTGSGQSDPDGTSAAWDPRSGTKIGNGW